MRRPFGLDAINVLNMFTMENNSLNPEQLSYFDRQIKLPNIGLEGQTKLLNSKAVVIGAGGLGCIVLESLVRSGVGSIEIIDYDNVDPSNLHRQTLFTYEDIGKSKVKTAANRLSKLNPWVKINPIEVKAQKKSLDKIIKESDILFDCTDNLETKFALHDFCLDKGIDYISSSIHKSDGQLQVFKFSKTKQPCLRCLWKDEPVQLGDCNDNGVLGVVPIVFGALQANEGIKVLLGSDGLTSGELLTFDLESLNLSKLKFEKSDDCSFCNESSPCKKSSSIDILLDEVKPTDILIDIRRENSEKTLPVKLTNLVSFKLSTSSELEVAQRLSSKKKYIILCDKGVRSKQLTLALRDRGFKAVYNLKYEVLI